jgi:hypothetical protein
MNGAIRRIQYNLDKCKPIKKKEIAGIRNEHPWQALPSAGSNTIACRRKFYEDNLAAYYKAKVTTIFDSRKGEKYGR